MPGEENETIARQYYTEAHDTGDVGLVNRRLASDYVHHNPFPGFSSGREGAKQSLALLHTAFPDLEFAVEDMVSEGNRVAIRWEFQGTHLGREWRGIPASGNPIVITGMHFVRIERGRIAEEWRNSDTLALVQQMGVIPSRGT